jgi:hypothetical protein
MPRQVFAKACQFSLRVPRLRCRASPIIRMVPAARSARSRPRTSTITRGDKQTGLGASLLWLWLWHPVAERLPSADRSQPILNSARRHRDSAARLCSACLFCVRARVANSRRPRTLEDYPICFALFIRDGTTFARHERFDNCAQADRLCPFTRAITLHQLPRFALLRRGASGRHHQPERSGLSPPSSLKHTVRHTHHFGTGIEAAAPDDIGPQRFGEMLLRD